MDEEDRERLKAACIHGNEKVVKDICVAQPDAVTQEFAFTNRRLHGAELTGLHVASFYGHERCARALLDAGADIEAKDDQGHTPLMFARNLEVVEFLLSSGAKVHARNIFQETALHVWAYLGWNVRSLHAMEMAGADVNAKDEKGMTPLMVLMAYTLRDWRHLDIGVELVRRGANVNTTDSKGRTLLHLCCNKSAVDDRNNSRRVLELVAAGTDLEAIDKEGHTALQLAAQRGNGAVLWELVELGAKRQDSISFLPCLRNAVENGDVRTLDRLVQLGASINQCDANGECALHFAVNGLQLDAVKFLLEHGGDSSLPNALGLTPTHIADGMKATASLSKQQVQIDLLKTLLAKEKDRMAAHLFRSENKSPRSPQDVAKRQGSLLANRRTEDTLVAHEHQLVQAGAEALPPDSVVVRFAGPPGAGKTTLIQSLQVAHLRSYFRSESQTDEGAANMQQRTKGIDRQTFVGDRSAHFTVFDLGGHGEFLATHQLFIGDGSVPVIDCVLVSALDELLEKNAFKWCSLFASRNQPTKSPWPLLLIASRADWATKEQQRAVLVAYHKVKEMLSDVFRFPIDTPLFVDSRKSWSEQTVHLRRVLSNLHQELVTDDNSPRKPPICQKIVEHLPALRKATASPVVLKQTFIDFMLPLIGLANHGRSIASRASLATLFDKALKYLSGYAVILSFSQPLAQRYVVINPRWLLSNIVGRLMAEAPLPGPCVHYDNGHAKMSDVVMALETEHLPGREALEMVADLGFCLEQPLMGTILNPSKLLGARQDEHWCLNPAMTVNAGRRLKCKGYVAIAPAFFLHLQVHVYHHYRHDPYCKLTLWRGGILHVSGMQPFVTEAMIEVHPACTSIDIVVRGREGSEKQCTDLLHGLTEETLQKAAEISPGSQLQLFYLSKQELDKLSPAGLPSRPMVEYSEERVMRAVGHGTYVTDGKASAPERPTDLLLPRELLLRRSSSDELQPDLAERLATLELTTADWRVILLQLAKAFGVFDECSSLADALCVNSPGEDIVRQVREVNPHRTPPEIAYSVFHLWLQRNAGQLTTKQRWTALTGIFRVDLCRNDLCDLLDAELREMCGGGANMQ